MLGKLGSVKYVKQVYYFGYTPNNVFIFLKFFLNGFPFNQ